MDLFRQLKNIAGELVALDIILVLNDIRHACYHTLHDDKYREIKDLLDGILYSFVTKRSQKNHMKIVSVILYKSIKTQSFIEKLKPKLTEKNKEYHKILGNILGYPCEFSNTKSKNKIAYSLNILFGETNASQLFGFMSDKPCDEAKEYIHNIAAKTKQLSGYQTYISISEHIYV